VPRVPKLIVNEFCEQLWDKDGFYPEFNMNPSLPWSVEFIERYIDYVCWELLSQNETVARNEAILYHFALPRRLGALARKRLHAKARSRKGCET